MAIIDGDLKTGTKTQLKIERRGSARAACADRIRALRKVSFRTSRKRVEVTVWINFGNPSFICRKADEARKVFNS